MLGLYIFVHSHQAGSRGHWSLINPEENDLAFCKKTVLKTPLSLKLFSARVFISCTEEVGPRKSAVREVLI